MPIIGLAETNCTTVDPNNSETKIIYLYLVLFPKITLTIYKVLSKDLIVVAKLPADRSMQMLYLLSTEHQN